MSQGTHPFIALRNAIRQSGRQFRRNNDNSRSLFHPQGGFIYGYDMSAVEEALDAYERTLPTEFHESHSHLTLEEKLVKEAHTICATNPSMEIRDFARSVAAYMVLNTNPEKRRNPLRLLKKGYDTPETDTLQ